MRVIEWYGMAWFFLYFIIGAGSLALLSYFFTFPSEIKRKSYHLMACGSIFVLLECFQHWYGAVIALIIFIAAVFVVVPIATKLFDLRSLSIQRGNSIVEILRQAVLFLVGMGIMITLIWGLSGAEHKIHIAIGMMALSFGDAAAAILGKRFGKRTLSLRIFDQKKTVEGSLAMLIFAFIAIFFLLFFFTELTFIFAFMFALILATLSAFVEAISVRGLDTILIPLVISLASLGLFLVKIKFVK